MRTARRMGWAAVALLAASTAACSSTEPDTAQPISEPEPVETSAPTTTEAPAPTTEPPATTTTTEAQPEIEHVEPAPEVVMWSLPRLHDNTVGAAWHVTPAEATCSYWVLDEDGNEQIGPGWADTGGHGPSSRSIRIDDYLSPDDEQGTERLGAVEIRCNHLGGDTTTVTHDISAVTYHNRHPESVFPATDEHYFDHDEVRALFPECGPEGRRHSNYDLRDWGDIVDHDGDGSIDYNDMLGMRLDFWQHRVFENWDTETREVSGRQIASGWWTTRQLRMRHPSSSFTASSARRDVHFSDAGDVLLFAPDGYADQNTFNLDWVYEPQLADGTYFLKHLYWRLEDAAGYNASYQFVNGEWVEVGRVLDLGQLAELIRDAGLPGDGPNPVKVRAYWLLWDWMDFRYQIEPAGREPTAWAMRTLLETRSAACVANKMRAYCESGEFHPSPHMRHPSQGGSRLGSVLWSVVCPEVAPAAP